MKVLMFGWEFPPFISGGLGMACHGITQGLINSGVIVKFILPTKRGIAAEQAMEIVGADEVVLTETYLGQIQTLLKQERELRTTAQFYSPYYTQMQTDEELARYQTLFQDYQYKLPTTVMAFTGNYGPGLMAEVQRYAIVGEFLGSLKDFDVIHGHDWLTIPACVNAKRASGKPLVLHVHATEYDRSGDNMNREVFELEKQGMQAADKIVAVSHYTKNIILSHYSIDPRKVTVVHNAVEKEKQIERFGIKRNVDEKIVLFLGRVTMQKGPDYFVEAANLVLKKIKNVRFVMAGSGDMMPKLITRMASLKIADRFHFTGFLSRLEVEKMYALSDLYVMPSVSEPFGISAFEALLYDVPIILSKQSGVGEILRDAIKVDFWDVEKLAATIINLLEDDVLAREMVEKCKNELKNIHWNNAGMRLSNLYHALVHSNSEIAG